MSCLIDLHRRAKLYMSFIFRRPLGFIGELRAEVASSLEMYVSCVRSPRLSRVAPHYKRISGSFERQGATSAYLCELVFAHAPPTVLHSMHETNYRATSLSAGRACVPQSLEMENSLERLVRSSTDVSVFGIPPQTFLQDSRHRTLGNGRKRN